MEIIYESEIELKFSDMENLWLALGNFDGVHLAHQTILQDAKEQAKRYNCMPGVLLLEPHPEIKFFHRENFLLTNLEEKISKIKHLGIKVGLLKPFTHQFGQISPAEFGHWLKDDLRVKGVSVGYDYSFGHKGQGTPWYLKELGKQYDFNVSVIEPIKFDNEQLVSSNLCRQFIREGQIEQANRMLSSPYQITGTVIYGEGRGRNLGFPTANLPVPKEKALPKSGVYLVNVMLDNQPHWGLCNIGEKPTFDSEDSKQGSNMSIEVYLLDSSQNLYHREISVSFIKYIRSEKRFPNSKDLVDQLKLDVDYARSVISHMPYHFKSRSIL